MGWEGVDVDYDPGGGRVLVVLRIQRVGRVMMVILFMGVVRC